MIEIVPFSPYILIPYNDFKPLEDKINKLLQTEKGIDKCLNNHKNTTIYFNFGKNNEMNISISLNYFLNQNVY